MRDKQKHQTLTLSIISKVLNDNAEQIFRGTAQVRALRDVWIKSRYLSSLFEVACKLSLDLCTARILDVGCSKCDILLAMQKLGANNLTGLNLFPFDLEWLSNDVYYRHHFGESAGKIKYVVCDIDTESFSFKDSGYDVVLLIDVLEHLHDPKQVLLECYRVLSPGGLIVITTPNMVNLRNRVFAIFGRSIYSPLDEWLGGSQRTSNGKFRRFIGHVREYTMQEINCMLSRYGFQVLLKRYYASHLWDKGISYGLYRLFESLCPRFRYHMLIVGRKPV